MGLQHMYVRATTVVRQNQTNTRVTRTVLMCRYHSGSGSVGREIKLPKLCLMKPPKTWYATFKTSWPAGAATNPERRKLHPETAFNLRMLHCALGGPAQGLAKPSQVSQSYGTLTRTFVLCVRQASLQILKVGIDARRPRLRYASRCCLYLLECS